AMLSRVSLRPHGRPSCSVDSFMPHSAVCRHFSAMRGVMILLAVLGTSTAASAAEGDTERTAPQRDESPESCLSQAEIREMVAKRTVIAPTAAIRTARAVASGGRIIRASLCRMGDELIY